jgi:hypothetical protein
LFLVPGGMKLHTSGYQEEQRKRPGVLDSCHFMVFTAWRRFQM